MRSRAYGGPRSSVPPLQWIVPARRSRTRRLIQAGATAAVNQVDGPVQDVLPQDVQVVAVVEGVRLHVRSLPISRSHERPLAGCGRAGPCLRPGRRSAPRKGSPLPGRAPRDEPDSSSSVTIHSPCISMNARSPSAAPGVVPILTRWCLLVPHLASLLVTCPPPSTPLLVLLMRSRAFGNDIGTPPASTTDIACADHGGISTSPPSRNDLRAGHRQLVRHRQSQLELAPPEFRNGVKPGR